MTNNLMRAMDLAYKIDSDAKSNGKDSYMCRCPAHDDRTPSLQIKDGDKGILIKCYAGCENEVVLRAMGIRFSDLFYENDTHVPKTIRPYSGPAKVRESKPVKAAMGEIEVGRYDYVNIDGSLRYQVVRYEPKTFKQMSGGKWGLNGASPTLYHANEVYNCNGEIVFLVEGEKDADTLRRGDVIATTMSGGSNAKWTPEMIDLLDGKNVVALPDNDPAGEAWAEGVATNIPHAKIVRLEGLPVKGDVSDWLADGGSIDRLIQIGHEEPKGAPVVFTWATKNALDTMTDYIPTRWIVDDIFESSGLFVVYGQPGGHKSNIMFDVAMAIATGRNFLPSINGRMSGFEVEQSPVFWLDCDNGSKRMHNRLHAFAHGYFEGARPKAIPLDYASMPRPHFDASKPEAADMLINQIKASNAKFCVIDNLGLVSGDVDESSSDMAKVMSTFRHATEETDAAIVLIHHERKGSANGNSRKGENIRGSSAIEASLDAAFSVTVDAEKKTHATLKPTKTRGYAISGFKSEWIYRWYPDTKDLERARFYALPGEALSDNDYARFLIETALHNNEVRGKTELIRQAQQVASRTTKNTRHLSDWKIKKELGVMESSGLVNVTKSNDSSSAFMYSAK